MTSTSIAPKISVIVPVYNMEHYLEQCLDSILAQTFRDFEVLVVDDGSTDQSLAICRRYERADGRIRVFARSNAGVSAARNFALSQAAGECVAFVDSDDWIEPDMYQTLYDNMLRYDADISIGGYWFEWKNRRKSRHGQQDTIRVFSHAEALDAIFADTPIQSMPWDKLYKRSIVNDFFPEGFFFEDHATSIKWFGNAGKVVMTSRPLYHYRMRRGSTVNGENPERRYHFLLAEIGRAEYLRSISVLNPADSTSGAGRVLAVAVDVAKNIARYNSNPDVRNAYLSKVVKQIQDYLPAADSVLTPKLLRRVHLLVRNPRRFVTAVRFSNMFEIGRRRNKKYLFD